MSLSTILTSVQAEGIGFSHVRGHAVAQKSNTSFSPQGNVGNAPAETQSINYLFII